MTAWDLAMDPMMVAGGHWIWDVNGAYFGVPLQNFWGWWVTTFVTFALFLVLGRIRPREKPLTERRFDRLAIISYAITGLSTVLVVLQSGSGGPALVGLFAMLPWVLWGWWVTNPAS
jgi:putative membrane protein